MDSNFINQRLKSDNNSSAFPNDPKTWAKSEEELRIFFEQAPLKVFQNYLGLIVRCAEEKTDWEWREEVEEETTLKILDDNFIYPSNYPLVNGVNYAGKSFNFYKVKTAQEVEDSFPAIPNITASNQGLDGEGIFLQKTGNDLEFKKIYSDDFVVTTVASGDKQIIKINKPVDTSFQGIDYYVNGNYSGTEELGTVSKPFKSLKNCIDKILNRGTFQSPSVNGGNAYAKWDLRPGLNGGAVRVIIQSYTEVPENIAINRVEYFLERGGYESMLNVPKTGPGSNLEYILDMKELVDNVPKSSGQLPYELRCGITGKGTIGFDIDHTQRKGFVRACGYNNGTTSLEQPDSNLILGSVGGSIGCILYKKPTLNYVNLYSDLANSVQITREGINMTGLQTSSSPDYGAIQVQGANAIFRESLHLSGTIEVNCFEQHLLYIKDNGGAYGDNGRIYIRRNYQHVNYSEVEFIDINPFSPNVLKFYKPSKHVYDFYLKDGAFFSYGGDIYTQENTGYSQGGSEAFVCLENSTTDVSLLCGFNANGGGKVHNLYYNHYIKSVLNPVFDNYQSHTLTLKGVKLTSQVFEEVISAVDTLGNSWTKILPLGTITDTILQDYLVGGLVRKPFSNLIVNDKLLINGNTIDLWKGMLNSNLPVYVDNTAALADGYPIGGIYRDNLGNLKIVI